MYFRTWEEMKSYVEISDTASDEQWMILVAYKSCQEVEEMRNYLNVRSIQYFGGIYAGLLVGNKNEERGFLVQKVKPIYSTLVLPYMMRMKVDPTAFGNATAIVLVDGLSSQMKVLTDTVYGKLGKNVKYVGGGAGFYDLQQRPCIFDNKGIYQDVLYVCIVAADARLAVKHGWNKLQGPFYVSESKENILSKLENDDAFSVYKQVIEEEERLMLFKEDFFMFAKDHPFGIEQEDGTLVVRDPITVNENDEIVCVADIPMGSNLFVLKGNVDSLLVASLQIAEYCSENAPTNYTPYLFNCISRAMFMEERFEEELANIQKKLKYQVQGALSIGEIASKRNGELVIHNKSTILALIDENF